MKKIIQFLFVLAPLFLMGQADTLSVQKIPSEFSVIRLTGNPEITESLRVFAERDYDCIRKDGITDWKIVAPTLFNAKCSMYNHDWVYAEHRDVNKLNHNIDLVYRPCGNGGEENQARICRECGMHQTRKRMWWYEMRTNKSEYKKLLEKFEGH